MSENSQAAVIEDSLASRFANPRLPGRWEFGTALDESKERPSELPAPFVNEPDSDHKAGSDPSQHSGPVLPSDADVTGSTAIRIDDRLQRDPRSAGLILPEKGAARQGMLRTKQGSRQTSVTPPLAVRDMSADALRAQLREAARPMLSQQVRLAFENELRTISWHGCLRMSLHSLAGVVAVLLSLDPEEWHGDAG